MAEDHGDQWAVSSWEPSLPLRPDGLTVFRFARLTLLLDIVAECPGPTVGLERLGYYDFFADAPLLIFAEGTTERRQLTLAGFSSRNLSYASAAQRFTNRRSQLQHDLAWLVSRRLAAIDRQNKKQAWSITDEGRALATRLGSMYALAFRESATLVLTRLGKLSDTALERQARSWLKAEPFLLDLWDELEVLR